MDITITATAEELNQPFPNFASKVRDLLEVKFEEAKKAATAKDDVVVTIATTPTKDKK